MKLQKLTLLLAIWSFGATIILLLNLQFNYAEILFFPSFSALLFFLIYKELIRHPARKELPQTLLKAIPWILLVSIVLFYLGIGMHGAANHIGYYLAKELSTASKFAHFYDEILSHITMYVGLFGLMLGGALIQIRRPFSLHLDLKNISVLTLAASTHGLGMAAAMIEGQTVLIGICAAILFTPTLLLHHQANKTGLIPIVKKYPFNFYIIMVMISTIFILLLYAFIFQGFPQLSNLFDIWNFM